MKAILLTIIVITIFVMSDPPVRAQIDENIDPGEIMERSEALMRSDSSFSEMKMEIITPDWRRSITFKSWDDRANHRSMIHILNPARDKDTTFLKLDRKLWMYVPRAERVIKMPPSMMLQSWMGSDFTNDDLVRESSLVNDYTHELKAVEDIEGLRCATITLTPKPGAAVTWGRIEASISIDPFVPVRFRYFNRRDEFRKEMIMSDIKEMSGRALPVTWTMRTIGKEGNATVLHLQNIEFNAQMSDRIFTQQFLRNPR